MPEVAHERALAKLTRSLEVLGRRADGYHLLRAEMVTLDFGDLLEIEPLDDPGQDRRGPGPGESRLEILDEVAWSGAERGSPWGGELPLGARPESPPGPSPAAPAVPLGADNLVLRALSLAGRRARVRLHKRIPAGAGLGGGSADAAAVLRWAGVADLLAGARLGADVPFCMVGGRALVGGVGEQVEDLEPDDACYLCCTPAFGVSTPLVYRAFDELGKGALAGRRAGANDLEPAAVAVEPRLALVRDLLAEVTGLVPSLAGSGSTWFVECDSRTGRGLARQLAEAVAERRARASITIGRTVPTYAALRASAGSAG